MVSSADVANRYRRTLAKGPRPVMLRLNADTSFLISIPYPKNAPSPPGRSCYNIVLDPWLQGPQSDVASWFSTQRHAVESSVKTIAELNNILRDSEPTEHANKDTNFIDLVVVSHEFTDHCHEATLKELDCAIPIFATDKAARLIQSWRYFNQVYSVPAFTEKFDWKSSVQPPLPPWLGVSRLMTDGNALYYHSAIMICFQSLSNEFVEAIVYTPHGVEATTFSAVGSAEPEIKVLAFLHGLHDVSLRWSKQLNLGAHNALKAQRLLQARYWIATHDEVKKGSGLITPILQRKVYTLQDALTKDRERSLNQSSQVLETFEDVAFVDFENGESLLLA